MMKLKSLVVAALLVSAGAAEMYAENYTIYPEPGSTLDDVYYLRNINITPTTTSFSVSETASATLECNETGDEFSSSDFFAFTMTNTIMVKFEDARFKDNGSYTLTIPAGQFTIGGEENAKIVVDYVLDDPNLSVGEFPQIELLSVDPVDGSKFPEWGDNIGKVKFRTSDDSAVNYIEWSLWDMTVYETTGEGYVTAGNDNRIDLNRYGNTDDQWADGLWIAVSGSEKLIKDHKYELKVSFHGIGYDPVTNQYPTPQQIEASKELETKIYYYGLTPPTEYSPYVVENVSPDPWYYEITDPDLAKFTITYTGPVKPVQFTYPLGMGAGVASAGTFEALGEPDAQGYSNVWEFTIDPEVILASTGMIAVKVRAQDSDGLYVKGNMYSNFDDFDYETSWIVRVGANELVSVFPEDGALVGELYEIVIGNHPYNKPDQPGTTMLVSYLTSEPVRITDRFGAEVRVLGYPEEVEGNRELMKWQFEPITDPGTYILNIPDMYFSFGEEFEGAGNSLQTFFTYIVGASESEVTYDLLPVKVTPADESKCETLSTVELEFAEGVISVAYPESDYMPLNGKLYKVTTSGEEPVAEAAPFALYDDPDDWFAIPTRYLYTFEDISDEGLYKLVIPEGTFGTEEYDMSMYQTGHASPELVYHFYVTSLGKVNLIGADSETMQVYGIDGVVLMRNASSADLRNLPSGLYVVNGRKYIVK